MFVFYDIEVLKHDWIVVFKDGDQYTTIHNDVEALKKRLKLFANKILVGFNNYHYDDIVVAGILMGFKPYETTQQIIVEGKRPRYKLKQVSLDVIQELPLNVSLKSSQANLGWSIVETPVEFDKTKPLTKKDITSLIKYCKNDVNDTEKLFKLREDYFMAKFEIVKEFELKPTSVRLTRANMASKVLNCRYDSKLAKKRDRLYIDYAHQLDFSKIPREVVKFFQKVREDYMAGGDHEKLERKKIKLNIAGVEHAIGFGGLHGALKKYVGSGRFLNIDVASYYPNLIINHNFMSRKSINPEFYEELLKTRFKLKKQKDPKEYIYKILLNATFGAMKFKYNSLFDPRQANNICINGQLILLQLIAELKNKCQLIQSNTDGILVKIPDDEYTDIRSVITDFGNRFNLTLEIDEINRVVQRDVNNYIIRYNSSKLKAKGRYAKYEGGGFEQNNLSIIDKCLVNFYMKSIEIEETIHSCYKNNDLMPFQIVAKAGATYDGVYQEVGKEGHTKYVKCQKVNRLFACNDKTLWGVYKRKGDSYQKIANTSEHNLIHNGSIETLDKSKLDLNYYYDLVRSQVW